MAKLTPKQERFVQEWFSTGNKTAAYKSAYNTQRSSESTINRKAVELSNNGKITARFLELSDEAQARNDTTVDKVDKMLKVAYATAKKAVKPAAMISATMGLVKLYGLDAETQAKLQGMQPANDDMTASEYLRQLADLLPD